MSFGWVQLSQEVPNLSNADPAASCSRGNPGSNSAVAIFLTLKTSKGEWIGARTLVFINPDKHSNGNTDYHWDLALSERIISDV
jgi:hypothetical protein